jgi:hypothetical protein
MPAGRASAAAGARASAAARFIADRADGPAAGIGLSPARIGPEMAAGKVTRR